jgi:hypothetical protein
MRVLEEIAYYDFTSGWCTIVGATSVAFNACKSVLVISVLAVEISEYKAQRAVG